MAGWFGIKSKGDGAHVVLALVAGFSANLSPCAAPPTAKRGPLFIPR